MKNIIVFTSNTWPYCHMAKEFLREKGYPFIERNLQTDPTARKDMLKLKMTGVPAFVIGDTAFSGLDKARIENLIDFIIIKCSNCNTKLRLPKGKGKISATCPNCNTKNIVNT